MSIATEITRLQNAKSGIRSKLTLLSIYIPENKLLSEFEDYITIPGTYVDPPEVPGVYIKYLGGIYSDSNVLLDNKTPIGVAIKTDNYSFTLYPQRNPSVVWKNITTVTFLDGSIGYCTSIDELDVLRLNEPAIVSALSMIGGDEMDFANKKYWSSTSYSSSTAWAMVNGSRSKEYKASSSYTYWLITSF